jgi:hypothetical protein
MSHICDGEQIKQSGVATLCAVRVARLGSKDPGKEVDGAPSGQAWASSLSGVWWGRLLPTELDVEDEDGLAALVAAMMPVLTSGDGVGEADVSCCVVVTTVVVLLWLWGKGTSNLF